MKDSISQNTTFTFLGGMTILDGTFRLIGVFFWYFGERNFLTSIAFIHVLFNDFTTWISAFFGVTLSFSIGILLLTKNYLALPLLLFSLFVKITQIFLLYYFHFYTSYIVSEFTFTMMVESLHLFIILAVLVFVYNNKNYLTGT